MLINRFLLKLNNIIYNSNNFYIKKDDCINFDVDKFIDNYKIQDHDIINHQNKIIIDNLFVIPTLHSCYSHALIDSIFPYWWTLNNDINCTENIIIFIKKKEVLFWPKNLPLIDGINKKYKYVFKDLIQIISKNELIFEHFIKR